MNTTTAALQAGVTTATIRLWARRRIITAIKQAGRWAIDAASLAHRITITALKTRKTPVTDIPLILTSDTDHPGYVGVIGPTDTLRAAYEAGTQITLSGKFEGERVYLGQTFGSDTHVGKKVGLEYEMDEYPTHPGVFGACYLVDHGRLDDAPKLRQIIDGAASAATAAEQSADADDDAYLNGYYE